MAIGDVGRVKCVPVGSINGTTTTVLSSLDHFPFFWAVNIVNH